MADGTNLAAVNHVVVLMLENRSFDHMLGYLYAGSGNVSPSGQPFEGLTGNESCPDSTGKQVGVYQITPSTPNAYFMPGADPGEGYKATNDQLWGSDNPPASGTPATMQGFVKDFAYTITWETNDKWTIVPGTTADMIMGCFTPEALPVMSALARGYAVCDHWYASAPTETMPNRAFAIAATSQGHMDDVTKTYTCPSIFGALTKAGVSWRIFGYDRQPLTRYDFPDITSADASHFGLFTDFQAAAAARHAARVHLPGAELALDGQQPAPELRRGPRRAADPRHVRGAARRPRLAADAVRAHLRRARRLLRPRPAAVGRDPAGQHRPSSASASTGSGCGCRRCSSRR